MTDDERRAQHATAKAVSRMLLDPKGYRASIAEATAEIETTLRRRAKAMPSKLAREPVTAPEPVSDHQKQSAALFNEGQRQAIGNALGKIREDTRVEILAEFTKLRRELVKLIHDTRNIADGALKRARADADRQRASMLSEIEVLRAKCAEQELLISAMHQKAATEAKIIDLPPILSRTSRHG